ncbi:sulfur carrier protein ThiS [Ruminococcus sp. OA3]|nr:sulfur carrier protein ThiS [Ruminococcus sp. OA3]
MIFVNGEEKKCGESMQLDRLLKELGYDTGRVAVELNQNIIPRARYGSVTVNDGDYLEVVRFVGGG